MSKILVVLLLCTLARCNSSAQQPQQNDNPNVVKVLYFHGKQRCATCLAIEKIAQETTQNLNNHKVVFSSIDLSTPEGETIADQYKVSSSSLLVVRADNVQNLTQMAFLNARNNPEKVKNHLTKTINELSN